MTLYKRKNPLDSSASVTSGALPENAEIVTVNEVVAQYNSLQRYCRRPTCLCVVDVFFMYKRHLNHLIH